MVSRDRKYKRWLFLASYALFVLIDTLQHFIGGIENVRRNMTTLDTTSAEASRLHSLNRMSFVLMSGVCFMLLLSIKKHKRLKSRPVNFLITGLSLWLIWGIFINFGGLALFATTSGSKNIIKLCFFTINLTIAIKITETYDLRKELVGITAFILGTILLLAYITHFNGLEFLASFSNILSKDDRYRISFGFYHYNAVGRLSLYYFMYTAIYRVLLEEKEQYNYLLGGGHKKFKSDALYKYLLCISPVIVIMLISSASRTSISSIIGFWLMYYFLRIYPKIRATAKAMIITVAVITCLVLIVAVDWGRLWIDFMVYSQRGGNYVTALPILTSKRAWITGFGFGFTERVNGLSSIGYLDSFYLYKLVETGLVGFFLLIGTILCFSLMYFRYTRYMTKFHRLAGGILAVMLWYGLFEHFMFNISAFDMLNWLLLIIATNERYSRIEAANHRRRHYRKNKLFE